MTQVYSNEGKVIPVTVVKADPCIVTQVRTAETDGYSALQVGIGTKKNVGKTMQGHLKKILSTGRKPFAHIKEVRVNDSHSFNVGDIIDVKTFVAGDKVSVTGTSKGKGFQGVVKRHGFAGSPASHGHKDQLRMPGSIGAQEPQRVFKGMRMGGRMGSDTVTVKNLEIVQIDEVNNLVFVKGALPGARNGVVVIKSQEDGQLVISGSLFSQPVEQKVEEPAAEVKPEQAEVKEEVTKEEATA